MENERPDTKIPKTPAVSHDHGDVGSEVTNTARPYSPLWNATTKLIIGLTVVALSSYLFLRFLNIVGPLMLTFILAYLIYPMVGKISQALHISWRLATNIIYLLVVVVLVALIAWGGLTVVEQMQSLIRFLQTAILDLPEFIENFIDQPIVIGPFTFRPDLLNLDVNTVGEQVLGAVQPILSGAGTVLGSFASSAASFVGWLFFILLLSYFIVGESTGLPNRLFNLRIPGYAEDLQRLGGELSRIWNAFLRGQLIIVVLTIVIYFFLLGTLGLKFFFGLALLAGLARFVPYVGPAVAWTSYGLVAFFQGTTLFGVSPLVYVAIVVGLAWLVDMILDNFLVPRIMSQALRVHPAAVLVSAVIAVNLLGIVGVVLAAPVLATMKLILDYTFNKLFDLNPWERMDVMPPPAQLPPFIPNMQSRYETLRRWINNMVSSKR
jgi:predicted PurR-regulated permease PerM